MCQQLYLPQIQQQEQNTTPPPSPTTLGQLKQVSRCRSHQEHHYYNNHHRQHAQTLLHKSQEFISSIDKHHKHHLRTLLLRNIGNMIAVPARWPSHLSFMLSSVLLLLLINSIHVVQSHNCQHLHPKAHEVRFIRICVCILRMVKWVNKQLLLTTNHHHHPINGKMSPSVAMCHVLE